jgi:ABC-type glycerol-3-phosphate transport system permease component
MKPILNPYGRLAMWLGLALFFAYSVMPFFWTALQSLKTLRLAFAKNPVFFFEPTFKNYRNLWLESTPQNLSMLGVIVLSVLVTIILLAVFSDRIAIPKWSNNLLIVLLIFFLIWIVPRIVNTAEFYNYFVNSVIVTTGVIIISCPSAVLPATRWRDSPR